MRFFTTWSKDERDDLLLGIGIYLACLAAVLIMAVSLIGKENFF